LDGEFARDYLAECSEHLDAIELDLLAIETAAATDDELVTRVFRAVHSVKCGAALFELVKIRELAHKTEDILALIRSHELSPAPDCTRVLLRAVDRLRALVHNPAADNQADIAEIVGALVGLRTPSQPRPRNRRLRILVAEDDFVSRLLLQTFLSRYGDCHVAVNGREAVEAFRYAISRNQTYDLICMDVMMPEMDGREAVRQIRALEESIGILSTSGAKIIITTAVRDVKEVIRCFQELCDAYMIKPLDMTLLLAHMREYQIVE
jgi:two-component system chemotaxis response regulator CheY